MISGEIMNELKKVAESFNIDSAVKSVTGYGCGHINDTYLIITEGGVKYILQKINNYVFPDVPGLMKNIVGVTDYIARKGRDEGVPEASLLKVIRTADGCPYLKNEDGYYRLYNFIDDAVSIETNATPRQFELSGIGFGKFQKMLDGYPASELTESIKDFHNTPVRLERLKKAVELDIEGRAKDCREEIDFYLSRESYAYKVVNLIASGDIPLRVTHNDTKLNNVLIDVKNDKAVAVIDLDTVMPGSVLYDFGDSIRSGANTAAEDEKDLSKVNFSVDLFRAFAKGFIGEVKCALTSAEIENMAFGAILMTYECGMRFLTDYLEGDVYFKVHRDKHNLDRTRTQIKMVSDMEKMLSVMNGIVKEYAR